MKTTVTWVSCDFPFCFFGFCADSATEPTTDNAKTRATSRLMLFPSPNPIARTNITITTRLVDTTTTPMLLKGVESGRLQPRKLATHRFALDDIMHAYETFEHAAREGALKVILTNETRG